GLSSCGGSVKNHEVVRERCDGAGSVARTRSACWERSVLAIPLLHRFEQLRGIEADSVLPYDLDVLDVGDPGRRVALDQDQVGVLADLDAADALLLAEVDRAV